MTRPINLFPVLAGCLASSLAAQNPAMTPPPSDMWPGAEIVEGVAFQGDGSVTLERGVGGLPVIAFWRPILFKENSRKPIAGRMECRIVASDGLFTEDAFVPDALHETAKDIREQQGFKDQDVLRGANGSWGDDIRQLDVVGRRTKPRSHYVLSYIMVRDGDRLIDIRRNCTFFNRAGVSKPDVLPYVYRYTKLTYAFELGEGEDS